jgi:hypothetical protein
MTTRLTLATIALLLGSTTAVGAQTPAAQRSDWEFRITSGGLAPMGDQRQALERADVSAAQIAWLPRPSIAVIGTFAWARSRDLTTIDSPRLDVFTSDVGVEARGRAWRTSEASRFTLKPFAGAGAGVRSYNHRSLELDATHNLAGYVAAGGEIGFGRLGLRIEVRDYLSGFKPLTPAGPARTDLRNDVVTMFGLRIGR